MKDLLLGIDVGTSACKVAVFDGEGHVLAQAAKPCVVHHPAPGWAEQDPMDWWGAIVAALGEMWEKSNVKPDEIAAIGLDGQGWSAIAVDGEGTPLCNTPIWYDTRSQAQCEELKRRVGQDRLFNLCGNPVEPAYTHPKILWYQQNRPDVMARTSKIMQSNAFVAMKLTGAMTHDLSQGYGMFCFDMAKGVWDTAMAKETGVNPGLLCDLVKSHEIVGRVTAAAAAITGLAEGTPVCAGGLDAACGTLGAGVVSPGQTQEQGGQAGGMSICMAESKADPTLILSFHVTGDTWLLQGGSVGGGGVMRWMESQLCAAERLEAAGKGISVFDVINAEADAIAAGCDGVVFLPYMAGERSPIWDPMAKGVYYGLDYSKTRAHMIRAGMEGVAYSLRHNMEVAAAAGAEVSELRAMGGSANSLVWTQIKSDVTGKPIAVPSSDTATTLGAALLAGVGVGMYPDFQTAVGRTVSISRRHTPNQSLSGNYDKAYGVYRKLYENLKTLMKEG